MEPGGVQFYAYGLPRIAPGKSLTVRLALHFGRRGEGPTPLEAEAIAAFRRYHTPVCFGGTDARLPPSFCRPPKVPRATRETGSTVRIWISAPRTDARNSGA